MWWVSQYCFLVYPIMTRLFGQLDFRPGAQLWYDLPAMLQAVTPKTRVMFVANPNNPTGTLAAREEVVNLIQRSAARSALGDGRSLPRISR